MTDTLTTIAADSPELLRAARVARKKVLWDFITGERLCEWYLTDGPQITEADAEALLRDAMVRELWPEGLLVAMDGPRLYADIRQRAVPFYADTMLAALYAAYLAARGKNDK